ncbi:MAG: hypothetical protein E6H50_01280 [Betaproteobacteria bacterium]|nr:MAG: hypothetical protein E6H50_01280 [Betaproteobacteria bacterium]
MLTYVTFIGHLYSQAPFYFFDALSQISPLLKGAPETDSEAIRKTVLGIFRSVDGNNLDIEVQEKKHPLLGKYFLLRLPCLYRGALFITRVRVSEDGVVHMDNDDALNVQGIFDDEETFSYYVLDGTQEFARKHAEAVRRLRTRGKVVGWILLSDNVVQWLFLPMFLFTCFVILSLGLENSATIEYLRELTKSFTITSLALLLGFLGTMATAFRFVFIEFIIYVRKYIPSIWSQLADSLDKQQRTAASKMGVVIFTIVNAVEFSVRTVMVLSLLIYGLSNLPLLLLENQGVHFGTAIASVFQSAPLFGDTLASAVSGTTYSIDTYTETVRKALSALTSFMLSTICLGLIGRSTKQAMSET